MGNLKTLLIIDDEEDLRDTVEYKFKSGGFKVETAVNGLDGLEKLKTVTPDLIILDINMPHMNGLEFYGKIKGFDGNPKYPVLVLTARANMEQLFRELDVDGFMAKPFELDQLFKEAQRIIKKYSGSIQKENGSEVIRARHVCIVEDDMNIFNQIALTFLESGYLVNSAHSGALAIKRITRDVPDVVVISLGLNDIAGDIVIGKLHRLEIAKDIKFILYTDEVPDSDKSIIMQKISEKEGISKLIESTNPDDLIKASDLLFQ